MLLASCCLVFVLRCFHSCSSSRCFCSITEDYFQPLSFEVRRKDGTVSDLFDETFNKQAAKAAEEKLKES
jgi:hypothetical protein